MDNAELKYKSIKNFKNIQKLIGEQENLYLDFKEASGKNGGLSDDDKRNFSKAASGFAHQIGGVIVWGIKARKDENDIDCAIELKPIATVKRFNSELQSFIKDCTEPVVDGIKNYIIFENDDKKKGIGYVISYFPRSKKVHRAIAKGINGFYKRHGDSFTLLSTDETKDLFFRNLSPELKLGFHPNFDKTGYGHLNFYIENVGNGIAKYPCVSIQINIAKVSNWYNAEGNTDNPVGVLVSDGSRNNKDFIFKEGLVLHPDQRIPFGKISFNFNPEDKELMSVSYKIYSENMIPVSGIKEFTDEYLKF
ncbi:MAG: ATP-binding protein [Candidatus Moranbacteria bacterium]|nr:ATP-binding protein [Candidatus Moranbacteria bacterium]